MKQLRSPQFSFYLLTAMVSTIMVLLFSASRNPSLAQGAATLEPTPEATRRVVSDNEVNQIAKGLYCPVCQNVPLEVCETLACSRWREQVRDLLAQGYTEQQVRQYFIEHFGAQTVGVPTNSTAQLLTIGLPLGLIALIGVIVAFTLIRWQRQKRQPTVIISSSTPASITQDHLTGDAPEDDYRARLESELRKRD